MSLYELLLFLHIGAVIIWIGSGFLLHVQAARANRAHNQAAFAKAGEDAVRSPPRSSSPPRSRRWCAAS